MYCKEYRALKKEQAQDAKASSDENKFTVDQIVNAINNGTLPDLLKQKD